MLKLWAIAHRAPASLNRSYASFDRCLDERLIERQGPGVWAFAHGLLRETFQYSARERGRWVRWHSVCADILARMDADSPARLAQHLFAAERYADAFGPLVSAAEHEHTRSAYRAAQRWLVKAAQCLRHARIPKDDLRWGEVYARWSICARVMGDFAPALRHAYRLNTLADTHDRHDMRARALLEIARGTDTTEGADAATPIYHAAVEAARNSGGVEILINCLTGLARAHRNSSHFELARTLYEEATSYCDPEAHPLCTAPHCLDSLD